MARFLVAQGADAKIPDLQGSTPLLWASIRGDEAMVKLLLNITNISNKQDTQGSAAWWARKNGHTHIAELIEHKVSASQGSGTSDISHDEYVGPTAHANLTVVVSASIKGIVVPALVSTGAQVTIMSMKLATQFGIANLIDKRFFGTARGNSVVKILGRIHHTTIILNGMDFPSSFTILEPDDVGLILGLDFLKRHRCAVDLYQNKLLMPSYGGYVPMIETTTSLEPGQILV